MKITKHQQKVLGYLKDGYVIKFMPNMWWLFKDTGHGYIHSIDLLHSTVKNLISHNLIRYKRTDKYRHKIYVLTPAGSSSETVQTSGSDNSALPLH